MNVQKTASAASVVNSWRERTSCKSFLPRRRCTPTAPLYPGRKNRELIQNYMHWQIYLVIFCHSAHTSRESEDSADSEDLDSSEKKLLEGTLVAVKPEVHWDDVKGLTVAKETLKETVILPVRFPHLFTGKCE